MSNISLRNYLNGAETSCSNFYDWFCDKKYLPSKKEKLDKLVMQISRSDKVNLDSMYVFYKNNCPLSGGTYDDFRICDLETGNVIWTVVPKDPRSGKAEVWGRENGFNCPIVEGSWKDVRKYFGV